MSAPAPSVTGCRVCGPEAMAALAPEGRVRGRRIRRSGAGASWPNIAVRAAPVRWPAFLRSAGLVLFLLGPEDGCGLCACRCLPRERGDEVRQGQCGGNGDD